jgi:gamma-glutamyltranspeptidase/glutathione hydrolase
VGISNAGAIVGQAQAAEEGLRVLSSGGNAVDAAVTAALVAGVVALPSCGIGGYGGAMVIALANGKVTAIDFNTTAPEKSPATVHKHGWLAAGVPGTLAGLDLALHRYGTIAFRQALQPAIHAIQAGFLVSEPLARSIQNLAPVLRRDPASEALLCPGGKPLGAGDTFRNPLLARMLSKLAMDNTTADFYEGGIARHLAREFENNGGRVTLKDLRSHRALEVRPIRLAWGDFEICTAPLTAGGATSLQALAALRTLDYTGLERDHARLESLRLAWRDRLELFGDGVDPSEQLSAEYAASAARRLRVAVESHKPIEMPARRLTASGTIHISAADKFGNMVALTLTHGDGFGACVTVPGLGLILGHGMSRFADIPGHPNCIGPRKRPLHNMCPTAVLRKGIPVIALGATGGRRIPNAIYDVLCRLLLDLAGLRDAVAAPRQNTTGGMEVSLTQNWPPESAGYLRKLGFQVVTGPAASLHAVSSGPKFEVASG